jgi:hypothetical protein
MGRPGSNKTTICIGLLTRAHGWSEIDIAVRSLTDDVIIWRSAIAALAGLRARLCCKRCVCHSVKQSNFYRIQGVCAAVCSRVLSVKGRHLALYVGPDRLIRAIDRPCTRRKQIKG